MFIYVFKEADRDELLKAGFSMVHGDDTAHMWVFMNNPSLLAMIGDGIETVVTSKLVFNVRPDHENGGGCYG